MMSIEHAAQFVNQLRIEKELQESLKAFIASEGFDCTFHEFRMAEWDALLKHCNVEVNNHVNYNFKCYEHREG